MCMLIKCTTDRVSRWNSVQFLVQDNNPWDSNMAIYPIQATLLDSLLSRFRKISDSNSQVVIIKAFNSARHCFLLKCQCYPT